MVQTWTGMVHASIELSVLVESAVFGEGGIQSSFHQMKHNFIISPLSFTQVSNEHTPFLALIHLTSGRIIKWSMIIQIRKYQAHLIKKKKHGKNLPMIKIAAWENSAYTQGLPEPTMMAECHLLEAYSGSRCDLFEKKLHELFNCNDNSAAWVTSDFKVPQASDLVQISKKIPSERRSLRSRNKW